MKIILTEVPQPDGEDSRWKIDVESSFEGEEVNPQRVNGFALSMVMQQIATNLMKKTYDDSMAQAQAIAAQRRQSQQAPQSGPNIVIANANTPLPPPPRPKG